MINNFSEFIASIVLCYDCAGIEFLNDNLIRLNLLTDFVNKNLFFRIIPETLHLVVGLCLSLSYADPFQ